LILLRPSVYLWVHHTASIGSACVKILKRNEVGLGFEENGLEDGDCWQVTNSPFIYKNSLSFEENKPLLEGRPKNHPSTGIENEVPIIDQPLESADLNLRRVHQSVSNPTNSNFLSVEGFPLPPPPPVPQRSSSLTPSSRSNVPNTKGIIDHPVSTGSSIPTVHITNSSEMISSSYVTNVWENDTSNISEPVLLSHLKCNSSRCVTLFIYHSFS